MARTGRPRHDRNRTCPRCGTAFVAKDLRTVHCSRHCAYLKDLPTKACERCGVEFRKDPTWSHAYWETRRFCSRKCRGNGKPKRTFTCETCGADFDAGRSERTANRFCSARCYGDWKMVTAPLEPHSNGDFSPGAKRALLERAGHQCEQCGSAEHLEFDHRIPRAAGGEGTVENGQVLCRSCHWEKTLGERQLMRTLLRAHYGLKT